MLITKNSEGLNCSEKLYPIVDTAFSFPPANKILEIVERYGEIEVSEIHDKSAEFEGYWDREGRVIYVNSNMNQRVEDKICTILFELHNALSSNKLEDLEQLAIQGRINKDEFVQKVEEIEHQNCLSTKRLIEDGVNAGIYPKSTHMMTFQDFEIHYWMQQITGHSNWLAEKYDQLNIQNKPDEYQGTLPKNLNVNDKDDFLRYLFIKDAINSPSDKKSTWGKILLNTELQRLRKSQKHNLYSANSFKRKLELLQYVLK